jgi:hypothetical protein
MNFLFCVTILLIGLLMWWRVSNIEVSSLYKDNNVLLNLRDNNHKDNINHLKGNNNKNALVISNKPKQRRIAFAITITKDGSFQDGAAVLAYSIYHANMTNLFDISLVAFVHPNVTTSRPILTRLGYHVIEVQTPIK